MKSKWKRNAIVGVMSLLVCVAVALNWKYAGSFDSFDAESVDGNAKLLGEATLVSGPEQGVQDAEAVPLADNAAGLVAGDAAYAGADYFASARLTRQQARDNAVSLLQEAAQQPDATEAVLNEASEGIQVLANYTMKEAQIENLVTAKGYQDCVAFMGDGSVSVVVSTGDEALQAEDVARIADIAMAETGFPASGVKIMSAN